MKIQPKEMGLIQNLRIRLNCPHCNTFTKISLVEYIQRPKKESIGIEKIGSIYYCESCLRIIYITWDVQGYSGSNPIVKSPRIINIALPQHDFSFVPESVQEEYIEALRCYGIKCYNAFASMCRRTIQMICIEDKIKGKSKVKKQAEELKKKLDDEEMSEIIDAIIIAGHNGAHPHLPKVTGERATKILALMNDLLDQIFNRPGRLQEAKELRKDEIAKKTNKS